MPQTSLRNSCRAAALFCILGGCNTPATAETDAGSAVDASFDGASADGNVDAREDADVADSSTADAQTIDASEVDAGPISIAGACGVLADGTAVAGFCNARTEYVVCDGLAAWGCDIRDRCAEWTHVDAAGHATLYASCVPTTFDGSCDPEHESSSCDGEIASNCVAASIAWRDGMYPAVVYPGARMRVDCATVEGAHCELIDGASGSFASCVDAAYTPCDPESFVPSCAAGWCGNRGSGFEVIGACEGSDPSAECVSSEFTDTGFLCVPPHWTPSDAPPTEEEIALRCTSDDLIVMAQYGYEWTEDCDDAFHISGPDSEPVPGFCFSPPDGSPPRCLPDGAELCDVRTEAPSCVDAMDVTSCHEWVRTTRPCGTTGREAAICDGEMGNCALPPSCVSAPGAFNPESCVNATHKWTGCRDDGSQELVVCNNCHENPESIYVDCDP